MSKSSVMAGMVLYNSDYSRLIECLKALDNQVENTIIYDNSPSRMDKEREEFLYENFKCEYIYSGCNIGMPEAMNKILEIGDNRGFQWVLTMNADSIVPLNLIEKFKPYFKTDDIAIVCPQVIDKRRKYMTVEEDDKDVFVDMCITSGACTRIEAWKQVGKFDGWLFVDLLDNDICRRMILNNWKIIRIGAVVLDQEFGDISPKPKWKETFWLSIGQLFRNSNIAKFSYKKKVNPIRVYYTCRNILYLNRKYERYGGIGYEENYNCHTFLGFIICFVVPSILRADKKIDVLKAVIKGFEDGKNKAQMVSPWRAEVIN